MPFVGSNQKLGKKTLGVDAIDNPKEYEWACPHCKSRLSHVKTHIRRSKFQVVEHFRHEKECPYSTERDTLTHLQMKKWVFDTFKEKYPNIWMEQKIGKHITDVAIRDEIEDGTKWNDFAIECQTSPITKDEILDRTIEYTKYGFYTLWVLHSDFLEPICSDLGYMGNDANTYKFRHFMKILHELYRYRIFFLDPKKSWFFVVRFTGRKWKTKKYTRIGNVTNLKLLTTITLASLKVASLYHKKVKK